MLAKEDSVVVKELQKIANLIKGNERQGRYYRRMIDDAKVVEITPIAEVLTPKQIEGIKFGINPQPKQCFKNATLLCRCLGSSCKYVEGRMALFGSLAIEHAWNKIGDKYIDITLEVALQRNLKEEEYVALGEYDTDEVMDICAMRGYYGEIYPEKCQKEMEKSAK